MIYPKFINNKSTITLVAPSFGCSTEPYISKLRSAANYISEKGVKIKYGPNALRNDAIGRSNTPEICAAEINESFSDNNTDAVISVGGGELMVEILPYVDFSIIRNNPKWYMGFSDNTNLTFLLPTICDVASIYGPCFPSFGVLPWHASKEDAWCVLTGEKFSIKNYPKWEKESLVTAENPLAPLNLTEDTILTGYPNNHLTFKGRLLGGCLDVLVQFLGTPFDMVANFVSKYEKDGIVWFIEACDLNPMAIRRAIFQLDLAGWFKNAKGFIFGRPLSAMDSMLGMDRFEACLAVLKKYNVPIIFDADLGHLPPTMPLITGSIADVMLVNNELTIKMQLK